MSRLPALGWADDSHLAAPQPDRVEPRRLGRTRPSNDRIDRGDRAQDRAEAHLVDHRASTARIGGSVGMIGVDETRLKTCLPIRPPTRVRRPRGSGDAIE